MANNTVYQPHKSSIGELDANYVAVACYGVSFVFSLIPVVRYFAWLAPLAIYFLEKKSVLVKFHAVQALILNAIGALLSFVVWIVGYIISKAIVPKFSYYDYLNPNYYDDYTKYVKAVDSAAAITMIFGLIVWAVVVGIGVLQILSALKAYKYSEYKIPVIGKIAGKVADKLDKVDLSSVIKPAPPVPPSYTPNQTYTPPAQTYTPPVQPYAAPPTPKFDTETGLPINPPEQQPAAPNFDTETGLPITPSSQPDDSGSNG